MTKIGDIQVGHTWESPEDRYGQYFYNEITRVENTKTGRIKLYATCKYRSPEGEITIQHDVPVFNGAFSPDSEWTA